MVTRYIKTVAGKDADYAYVIYDKSRDKYSVIVMINGLEYLRFNHFITLSQAKAMVNDLVAHRADW